MSLISKSWISISGCQPTWMTNRLIFCPYSLHHRLWFAARCLRLLSSSVRAPVLQLWSTYFHFYQFYPSTKFWFRLSRSSLFQSEDTRTTKPIACTVRQTRNLAGRACKPEKDLGTSTISLCFYFYLLPSLPTSYPEWSNQWATLATRHNWPVSVELKDSFAGSQKW